MTEETRALVSYYLIGVIIALFGMQIFDKATTKKGKVIGVFVILIGMFYLWWQSGTIR